MLVAGYRTYSDAQSSRRMKRTCQPLPLRRQIQTACQTRRRPQYAVGFRAPGAQNALTCVHAVAYQGSETHAHDRNGGLVITSVVVGVVHVALAAHDEEYISAEDDSLKQRRG